MENIVKGHSRQGKEGEGEISTQSVGVFRSGKAGDDSFLVKIDLVHPGDEYLLGIGGKGVMIRHAVGQLFKRLGWLKLHWGIGDAAGIEGDQQTHRTSRGFTAQHYFFPAQEAGLTESWERQEITFNLPGQTDG